ncbi:MAG: 23S rRNA (adenine(2503)-C(2))-methyltransferase RlmN [Myxococcota bacterium]|nr:23S rRNA (adenine(2503)-C(2))-methyltransferase RlmN [Myxococcota bacterium]
MESGIDILGIPRSKLGRTLDRLGVGRVHTNDVFAALHSCTADTSRLARLGPQKKRRLLESCLVEPVRLCSSMRPATSTPFTDAEKLLFTLRDSRLVEGVLLPQKSGRVSVCVSSQAGCGMGCRFCATAQLGFERHLSAGEIIGQVIQAAARCRQRGQRLSGVVFMGMGEPLQNYRALKPALEILLDHHGLMLAARNITVSTVGSVKGINQLAADFGGTVSLALSLVAGTQATRETVMPTAQHNPLAALKAACSEYPLPGARRYLLLEYPLLPGVNDTDEELEGVARFADGLNGVVNLIPFNPYPGAEFRSPTHEEIDSAWKRLTALGVKVTIRRPRGRNTHAACGQLARRNTVQA